MTAAGLPQKQGGEGSLFMTFEAVAATAEQAATSLVLNPWPLL